MAVAVVVANVELVNGTTVVLSAKIPVAPVLVTVALPAAVPEAPRVLTTSSIETLNGMAVPDPAEASETVATEASATVPKIPARTVNIWVSALLEVHVPRMVMLTLDPTCRVAPGIMVALLSCVSVLAIAPVATTVAARAEANSGASSGSHVVPPAHTKALSLAWSVDQSPLDPETLGAPVWSPMYWPTRPVSAAASLRSSLRSWIADREPPVLGRWYPCLSIVGSDVGYVSVMCHITIATPGRLFASSQ